MKLKKAYTITASVVLIGLYIIIFFFSSEDGASSSKASSAVTEALIKGYYGLWGQNGKTVSEMVMLLEGIVRKMAHFTEYLCVGLLSYSIVVLWCESVWKGRFLVVGQLLISAGLDEFHQYFIPGRNAAFKDVMIDTAGGITGILLFIVFKNIVRAIGRLCRRLRPA